MRDVRQEFQQRTLSSLVPGVNGSRSIQVPLTPGCALAPLTSASRLRTDAAPRENELHRQRFTGIWHWWHAMPDGPERTAAMHWYRGPPKRGRPTGQQRAG
jgi:hypothetical protein